MSENVFAKWEKIQGLRGRVPRTLYILVRSMWLELRWKILRRPCAIPDSCQAARRLCRLERLILHLSGGGVQ